MNVWKLVSMKLNGVWSSPWLEFKNLIMQILIILGNFGQLCKKNPYRMEDLCVLELIPAIRLLDD